MAKRNKTIKATHLEGPQGAGISFEHSESFDDNLLPEAEELARLKMLDPDIIEWIKATTSKEQAARHDSNSRKIKIIESAQAKAYRMDRFQVICASIIILAGMGLSAFLILKDQIIVGSIFGGATIVVAANSILKFGKQQPPKT